MPELLAKHHLGCLAELIRNGRFAVQLFFILSGFILTYTYSGKLTDSSGDGRFWEARFARVWPLYLLSLLLSSWFMHTTPHLPAAVATICMVQSWNPLSVGSGGSWNGVCWTLSCEAFFYVLFPYMQRLLERSGIVVLCAILGGALAFAIAFCTGDIGAMSRVPRGIPLALARLPDFIVGMCLGNIFLRLRVGSSTVPLCTALGMAGVTWTLLHSQRNYVSFAVVFIAIFLFGLASERTFVQRLLSSRPFLVGGAASYAMYLVQWPVKAMVKLLCSREGIRSANLQFGMYLVLLVLLSCVLHFTVEEPARELIRRGFSLTAGRTRARRLAGVGA